MRSPAFTPSTALGIHYLITIYLRTSEVRVTTDNVDRSSGGDTWSASAAVNVTQIKYSSDGTPMGADIRLMANPAGPIKPGQATRGELDGLDITLEAFDTGDFAAGTFDMLPGATIGSAQEDTSGVIILAVQGPIARAQKPMAEIYTLTCKAKFGDDRCKKPLDVNFVQRATTYYRTDKAGGITSPNQAWVRIDDPAYRNVNFECTTQGTTDPTTPPTYPTTPGVTVTDGTAVFTCRAALMTQATGQALDFFNIQLTATPSPPPTKLGMIIPRTGPMTGLKIPIRAFDSGTNIVTLFEPYAPINFPALTDFDVHPGCDKLLPTCRDTYDNLENMRATPYAPDADLVTGRA